MHIRPIAWARSFIIATNRGTVLAVRWASAIAASLPDGSINPYNMALNPTHLPFGSTPTPEPW